MPLLIPFGNQRWSVGFLILISTLIGIFSIVFGVLIMSFEPSDIDFFVFSSPEIDIDDDHSSAYVYVSPSVESNHDHQRGLEYIRAGEIGLAYAHFRKCANEADVPFCKYAVMEIDLIESDFEYSSFDRKISEFASSGNPDAQYLNALLLSNRFDNVTEYTSETFPVSVLHMYAASTASHSGALMSMGYRHLKGYGVPKRCETAALNYLEVAKPVANIYATSVPRAVELVRLGIEKDKRSLSISEISLFTEVANVNFEIALAVGKRYLLGTDGFPQDYALARKFLTLAASDEKTSAPALALTGYLYALGLGVPLDMDKAESFFEQSLEDGMGMNGLGFIRFKQERFSEAFALFNQSATAGSPDGMFNLASLFLTGTGTQQNFQKAFMFYTEALRRGHTPAGYSLAVMHLNGIGTVRDCGMAVSLLKEVAERGEYVSALLRSAYALVEKGETEYAALQFLKLAEAGHQVSQENLAHLIDSGQAMAFLYITERRKKISSQRFFEMAAEQGSVKSALKLGDLAFYGGGLKADFDESNEDEEVNIIHHEVFDPDYQSAFQWYAKARDQGTRVSGLVGPTSWISILVATAEFNLAYMYHWGLGVRKNLVDAAKHYKRAIPESSHGKLFLEWIVDTFVHSPADIKYSSGDSHDHEFPVEVSHTPSYSNANEPSSFSIYRLIPSDYRLMLLFFLSWLLVVLIYARVINR